MTPPSALAIHLLLARYDDQSPVLAEALDGRSSAREPRPSLPDRRASKATLRQRDELAQQGWGVVAPPGKRGDHLLELVQPLMEHRRAEQGAKVRVLRSPPSPGDVSLLEAVQWRDVWNQKQPARGLPYYLLILGGFDDVPLAVQRALSVTGNHAVGRLFFDHDRQYRAYADKLCTRERAARRRGFGDIVLHAARGRGAGDGPGHRARQLFESVRAAHPGAAEQVRESGSDAPRPDELQQAAASTHPSVLFSTGHGLGAPRGGWTSSAQQRACQGALGFGDNQRVTGEDVSQRVFLPGGVWLMHSSFSIGTPRWSSCLGWLQKQADTGAAGDSIREVLLSRPIDDTPFLASLPRAALANKSGPLAVIGHVDLAWAHGFSEPVSADGSRSSALAGLMVALAHGHRVGSSMSALFDYLGHVDSYLVSLYARAEKDEPAEERERALFWLLREELAGYVMLGDPAARLSVQPPVDDIAPALSGQFAHTRDAGVHARLERAIADHILGQPPSVALARQRLATEISEERFVELARAYRAAGAHVLERVALREPE